MNADLYPERSAPRIDYALMQEEYPKLKAALTRAERSGDPLRVRAAVARFVQKSDAIGCMPDDWPRWRNALEDAFEAWRRTDAADDDYFERGGVELGIWREVAARFDF